MCLRAKTFASFSPFSNHLITCMLSWTPFLWLPPGWHLSMSQHSVNIKMSYHQKYETIDHLNFLTPYDLYILDFWKIKFEKSSLKNQVWKIKLEKSSLKNQVWKIQFEKSSLMTGPSSLGVLVSSVHKLGQASVNYRFLVKSKVHDCSIKNNFNTMCRLEKRKFIWR